MSKKSLNTSSIQNELRDASVFFRQPTDPSSSPTPEQVKTLKQPQSRTIVPPQPPTPDRKLEDKRTSKRRKPTTPKSRSSEVPKSGSPELPKLRSYEVRKFDELRRLDIRVTWEQKRFLDDWEEEIRQAMPEGDTSDPRYQRITKNSLIRVILEIIRQLDLRVDPRSFRNEADLMHAVYEEMIEVVTKSRTPEVRKSVSL